MIVCLDLETTGLDKNKDKIIEISMVKFDEKNFEEIDSFNTLVNPEVQIPQLIKNLTNIDDQDVLDSPKIEDINSDIKNFIADNILLGHNVSFDIDFLDKNGISLQDNEYIDTLLLSNFLDYKSNSLSLDSLCCDYNIDFFDAHRAKNDVIATIKLFKKQLEKIKLLSSKEKNLLFYILSRSNSKNILFLIKFLGGKKIITFDKFESIILESISRKFCVKKFFSNPKLDFPFIKEFLRKNKSLEKRENQEKMLKKVWETFIKNEKSLIEAPTGLGKSFAYLIPSIIFSLKTSQRVYISTNTKTLQDQIFFKDIDFIHKNLGQNFSYVKLKGKRNYICIDSFFRTISLGNLSYDEASVFLKISFWLLETNYGELDELNFYGQEFRIIKNLNSEFLKKNEKNKYKKYEFLFRAQDSIDKSNLIIINHSLLFSDIEGNFDILKDLNYLVIDEAHNIEDSCSDSLKKSLCFDDIKNFFKNIEKIFISKKLDSLDFLDKKESFLLKLDSLEEHCISYYIDKSNILDKDRNFLIKDDFFYGQYFENLIEKINLEFTNIIDFLRVFSDFDFSKEIKYLESIISIFLNIFDKNKQNLIKIINNYENGILSLEYTLLNPGEFLQNKLWSKINGVILTSATLKVGDDFSYIKFILKLDSFSFFIFESDFDYSKQALFFSPIYDGNISKNLEYLNNFLKNFFMKVSGNTIVLFTSFSSIKKLYNFCFGDLKKNNISLLAQSVLGGKKKILSFFNKNPNKSILLGTNTFWEGLDFPENNLKYLIIYKLPFNVPSDPIFQSRSKFFKDPFLDYCVPKATLKFKQGFGRLIRSKNDKGICILLDNRIDTIWGKVFLKSLPHNIKIKRDSLDKFLDLF